MWTSPSCCRAEKRLLYPEVNRESDGRYAWDTHIAMSAFSSIVTDRSASSIEFFPEYALGRVKGRRALP